VAALSWSKRGSCASTNRSTSWWRNWPNRRVPRAIDAELDDTVPACRAITVEDLGV
jgi:hypothetical protein